MATLVSFFVDSCKEVFKGGRLYWGWMALLVSMVGISLYAYSFQVRHGLVMTGLSDQISWGVYIANFAFLVGVAAAAVMLVIPAYLFHRDDVKHVVLIGEGIAVAAATMAILFVTVDLGRPDRIWHMLPFVGRFNFPTSLLAWDVVVLSGYLLINLAIPFYLLFSKYRGREPSLASYFPAVVLSIAWAISIHTVTAFLFSSNVGRPYWHTAVLGPRFLASAFCSGPALIILALQFIERTTLLRVSRGVIDLLAVVVTISLQISLFLLGVEIFTDFYFPTEHTASAVFLFFGLNGYDALVPWIWSAVAMNVTAALILSFHATRRYRTALNVALVLLVVGVWIEKGMGLIIPGFVPTPIGEVFEYTPTLVELFVSLGIWAFGLLVFTVLAKVAIPIELGSLQRPVGGEARPPAAGQTALQGTA
ncbi:MAG: NrfD/PsrC family molybdoenzyme membrane anchor subunit [bacterium]